MPKYHALITLYDVNVKNALAVLCKYFNLSYTECIRKLMIDWCSNNDPICESIFKILGVKKGEEHGK